MTEADARLVAEYLEDRGVLAAEVEAELARRAGEKGPAGRTLFALWHYDGRDYYVKETTLVGVYSTRAKAVGRHARERELEGPLSDLTDAPDVYFWVGEVVVDE